LSICLYILKSMKKALDSFNIFYLCFINSIIFINYSKFVNNWFCRIKFITRFRERKKVFFLIKLSYVKELVFLKVICNFAKYINIFFILIKNQMRSYYWREFKFWINYLSPANFNYFWNVVFMAVYFYVYKQVLYITRKKEC